MNDLAHRRVVGYADELVDQLVEFPAKGFLGTSTEWPLLHCTISEAPLSPPIRGDMLPSVLTEVNAAL